MSACFRFTCSQPIEKKYILFTDARRLCKEDIYRQNILIKVQLANWDRKFKKASEMLKDLRRKYEASKQYNPLRRYPMMKRMIEEVLEERRLDPQELNM